METTSNNCVTPSQNPGQFSTPLLGCFDCCGPVYEGDLLDVRKFAARFGIGVEDPQFKGSLCPWHYIIVGEKGSISPDGPGTYWVSIGLEGSAYDHTFNADELPKYLKKIKAIRK